MEKSYYMNNAGAAQHLKFNAAMPIPWNGANLVNTELNSNSYMNHYYTHLESTLSSVAPSTAAPSDSPPSGDAFSLRELIANHLGGGGSVSSSPKPHLPPVPSVACDPGFAERAAKFSCFGSRSFNGSTALDGGAEFPNRSDHFPPGNAKLSRVSSSPALRRGGSPIEIKSTSHLHVAGDGRIATPGSDKKSSSNEDSSVSTGTKKRKAVSRVNPNSKSNEGDDDGGSKRTKPAEIVNDAKTGPTNDEKANQKPPEPPKDYIHVRARRGQATDSHSLAERVRREKIGERMKLLQDLVPGCNKVTGKALMLDEIINYVQSLQRQVEFLSMKLATVNPGLESNVNSLHSKDVFQENGTLQQQQLYPIDNDASSTAFYHHQQHRNDPSVTVDPTGIQFPSLHGFSEFPPFGEDDLQSIVHMGFTQNLVDFPVKTEL